MFTTYYRDGVKAGMQLIDGTAVDGTPNQNAQTYEIKVPPVDADGTRQWMQLHCREVLENGG